MKNTESLMISVVIVNYNSQEYLADCIKSLASNLNGLKYEIIIVDNNSTDTSCIFIKEHFPEVKLIESTENLGFGRANNLGVEHAKGNTILLINNDTIVQNYLLPAIETLHSKPENGVVTINMLDSKKEYITGVGRFPTPFRLFKISLLKDNRKVFKTGEFDDVLYNVDWVCGAFMLIRKADYVKIGGFDPDYFMYVEDVDLCKRLADIGKYCVFRSDLNYIHFVGFNKSREPLLLKGYDIYAEKHFDALGKRFGKLMIATNRTVKSIKRLF